MAKKASYRLPRQVRPKSYSLELTPNFHDFTFNGSVLIDAEVLEETKTITLHSLGLEIQKVEIIPKYGTDIDEEIPSEKILFDNKLETVTLPLVRALKPGQVTIKIQFSGKVNANMHGLYRTTYAVNGEKRIGLATQCEATHARRIFPCFDEPDLKALFLTKLNVPKNMTALANMPLEIETSDPASNSKRVIFGMTPLMSTYLFAFVIAELECIEGKDKNGIPIRVWTTPGKKDFGRFALDCALHTVPFFTEYFDVPYPLPKLDMVALPDFSHGAMENWGLITYRETALLVDPANTSAQVRQRVAEVVDHEIAHMWFGNLVTMKWWDDLWLNEGFASYAGPLAVVHQFPEWDFWTQFNAADVAAALHADSSRHTHPIEVQVENPKDIGSIFDAISYSKGAAICRMLGVALGDSFRIGVAQYLKQHAYGNATTTDLWTALEAASGQSVKQMMEQFTQQSGYPVVAIKSADKFPDYYEFTLAQHPFTLDGRVAKSDKRRWKLPVAFANHVSNTASWQNLDSTTRKIGIRYDGEGWIKLNFGQTGFYRVAYIDELWQKLAYAAGSKELPAIDRLGLVDDALALARSGYTKTSSLLGLLSHLKAESNYAVWTAIARAYGAVENILRDSPENGKLRAFGQELFYPVAGTKGWDKGPHDDHLDVLKRSLLLYSLGMCGSGDTIREAQKRFWDFAMGKELDPDIRQVVYSLTARYGGWQEMSTFMSIYDKAELHEEKVRVLRAIGHFTDPTIINRVLEFTASEKVRKQDHQIILAALGANPRARPLTWEFIKTRWEWLHENHNDDLSVLGHIVESVASGFKTAEDLGDVRRFLNAHKLPGLGRTFKQVLEAIESKICWLKRDEQDITAWIEKHEYGVPG